MRLPRKKRGVPWFVYILKCRDESLYVGMALDPVQRLKTHRAGTGSKYVRSRLPAQIVYTEKMRNRSGALKREAQIKKLTRAQKIEILKKQK